MYLQCATASSDELSLDPRPCMCSSVAFLALLLRLVAVRKPARPQSAYVTLLTEWSRNGHTHMH